MLPPFSGEYVYRIAEEPKSIQLYPGAGHGLDEVAGEVEQLVRGRVVEQLSKAS